MIRGIVISVIEGLIKLFSSSGRTGESFEEREYFQHYGFTSRPLAGAEIIIIREGNHIIAVASDDRRYRLAIADGEVALYTDEGDKIHLKRGRIIDIVGGEQVDITTKVAKVTASVSCEITSPAVTINASTSVGMTSPEVTINAATSVILNSPAVQLGGSSGTMRAIIDERLIDLYDNHTHGEDGKPVVKLSASAVKTAITKAG